MILCLPCLLTRSLNCQAIEECMSLMSLKGRYSITCPPETAFGMRGYPPIIPPMATVIYEIELITFTNAGKCRVEYS